MTFVRIAGALSVAFLLYLLFSTFALESPPRSGTANSWMLLAVVVPLWFLWYRIRRILRIARAAQVSA